MSIRTLTASQSKDLLKVGIYLKFCLLESHFTFDAVGISFYSKVGTVLITPLNDIENLNYMRFRQPLNGVWCADDDDDDDLVIL